MAELPAPPDPERDLAFSVLRGREAGATYRSIAYDLGLSPGKAQHLVKDLVKARQQAAWALTRPPSRRYRAHRPEPGEVLGRLRDDMLAIEQLLTGYPDEESIFEDAIAAGDRVFFDAAATIRRVLAGIDDVDVAGELASIEVAFVELLLLAHKLDPTLRDEVDAGEVLATFHRDLEVLAGVTGSDLGDLADSWKDRESRLRPTGNPPLPSSKAPMGREKRRSRNEAIVRARLSGTPANMVAEGFGISTRQVRRVMVEHRAGSFGAAPAAIAAAEEAVEGITRQIDQHAASGEGATAQERAVLAREALALHDARVEIYRQAGLLTHGAIRTAAAAAAGARCDQLAEINGAIRKSLTAHGIEREVIEDVIDQVIEVSGVEVPDGEG